ncbi:hypothetical protein HOE37_03530 [Candidatus Woesearchaeota archaeon]|jgi:hypothetical protein|nr:hypothetical protein [Candidatus Woesearchaeota archaeon]MBT4110902.1 hypothetical protein [Candidatus Woesearchaeota archaeon]MBT4336586.1 hypothetical protein [Candidatus Woesearchaeota archaeon]MBT4469665.1 hypothetical protein [Candidatus Woesearchaeota archaeon]MBT6744027.1 hypothetical protein [Candidatus Woesearchaeota archaeon]
MVNKKITLILSGLLVLLLLTAFATAAVKTFTVKETDLVKVKAEALDVDGDKLFYYYSTPLDDNGEWQTGYDDAGEYDVDVTVSDGVNQVVKTVKIVIENKNQAPYLTEEKVSVKETQIIDLKDLVSDPDGDPLNYVFSAPFDKDGVWSPGYNNAGSYVAEFKVSDGEFNQNFRVGVDVLNTNQAPEIVDTFSDGKVVAVKEDEKLSFYVQATDNDKEEVTYLWQLDQETIGEESSGKYYFDFDSSGTHTLKLTVSDGSSNTEKEWTIEVEHVNRKPDLTVLPVTVKEGENAYLDLPDVDQDGDDLSYSFETPLNDEGEWQTGYEDAGTYKLDVTASDGEFIIKRVVEIKVIDVDRTPDLVLPEKLYANENEEMSWAVETSDPDGDKVKVSIHNLPADAEFDGEVLEWTPSFDYIKRSGKWWSNVLNKLRLEHLFLKKRMVPLEVTACGKELCTVGTVDLYVYNVNRMPEFSKLDDVTITETELAELTAEAIDPDGDIVNVYYSKPTGKRTGEWQTDYEDEGTQVVFVTATDGKIGNTQTVDIDVLKNNREPSLKIKKDVLVVNENQQFMFVVSASDPDSEDELEIRLDNIPPGASFNDGVFLWQPGYNYVMNKTDGWWSNFVAGSSYLNKRFSDEQTEQWLSFVAADGEVEVVHPVKVIIKNTNRVPEILDYIPVEETTAQVGEEIIFHVVAKDLDGDKLTYEWDLGLRQQTVKGTDTITRTFTSGGKKKVKLTVSDGRDSISKEWIVNVPAGEVLVTEDPVEQEPFTVKVWVVEG